MRLALIAGIELLVLAVLIGLSYVLKIPRIPGPIYLDVGWPRGDEQLFAYPYSLIPVMVVAAIVKFHAIFLFHLRFAYAHWHCRTAFGQCFLPLLPARLTGAL